MRGHPGGWRPWRGVLAGALLLASGCVIGGPPTPEPPPNIVIFLADDLGIGEVGAWGQREIATPNIDRLAREGVRLTEFRSGAAVCGPARCTLMTGYHMGHAFVRDNANPRGRVFDEEKGLFPGQIPIPDATVTVADFVTRYEATFGPEPELARLQSRELV